MVTIEPCNRHNDPTNVRVIIQGGVGAIEICHAKEYRRSLVIMTQLQGKILKEGPLPYLQLKRTSRGNISIMCNGCWIWSMSGRM